MQKKDLIKHLSDTLSITRDEARMMFDATFDELTSLLAAEKSLNIPGFGTFGVTELSERSGYNPLVNKWMMLPPKLKPTFKASEKFKSTINTSPETRIIE
jgi:nucleoid DNA-binding protein